MVLCTGNKWAATTRLGAAWLSWNTVLCDRTVHLPTVVGHCREATIGWRYNYACSRHLLLVTQCAYMCITCVHALYWQCYSIDPSYGCMHFHAGNWIEKVVSDMRRKIAGDESLEASKMILYGVVSYYCCICHTALTTTWWGHLLPEHPLHVHTSCLCPYCRIFFSWEMY